MPFGLPARGPSLEIKPLFRIFFSNPMRLTTTDNRGVTAAAVDPPDILRHQYERSFVESMFDSIASRYDLLNRILSLGLDVRWRRRAVRTLSSSPPARLLDLATGTADVAIAAARRLDAEIIGLDMSERMLERARRKVRNAGLDGRVSLRQGTAEALPFEPESFDAVTVAFGVRNFADLDRGLSEMARVLRSNGAAVVLEFSTPRGRCLSHLYRWYAYHLLPRIGGLISGNREAYEYLPRTATAFPSSWSFARLLRNAGFAHVTWEELSGGICTVYYAVK